MTRVVRHHLEDPLYSQRNPYQLFLLVLSVAAAFPLITGRAASTVLERELSDSVVTLWGIALLVGSVIALIGEVVPGHTWSGLVLERAGLGVVGGAAAVYAGVVLASVDDPGGVVYLIAIQLAYALSCAWRCGQITRRLRWIRAVADDYERTVETE